MGEMEWEGGDDRAFEVNFTAEGEASLKERSKDKLVQFMEDYADDTLVGYVTMLVRNGRRKTEVAKELHIFLGDDNLPFISWLWDYLSSNLQLYVEPPPPAQNQKDKNEGKI